MNRIPQRILPILGVVGAALAPAAAAAQALCVADAPRIQIVDRQPGQACPALHGAGEPLFADVDSGPLARFCRYTMTNGQDEGWPDCTPLAPQAPLTRMVGEHWRDAYEQRLARPALIGERAPVTVAVVDTLSDIDFGTEAGVVFGPPRSRHGLAMAALVDRIAPDTVRARMTVPAEVGGLAELAIAIHDMTAAWSRDGEGEPLPLVINLSLGWQPESDPLGGVGAGPHLGLLTAPPNDVPAPVRAVHAAIVEAVCAGALVVASAGNDPDGRGEAGALLPAAWTSLRAPSRSECAQLFGPGGRVDPRRPHSPQQVQGRGLVEAVGGVDLADTRLTNARIDSVPRLVAPAQHVAVNIDERGRRFALLPMLSDWYVLTGTSVAAATTSGAAAVVWSRRPDLTADAVAKALYDGGVALDAVAELPAPGARFDRLRRISICGALAEVGAGEGCGWVVEPPAYANGALLDVLATLAAIREIEMDEYEQPALWATHLPTTIVTEAVTPPAWDLTPASDSPGTKPQPEWPECSACYFDRGGYTLVVDRADDGAVLDAATLTLNLSDGTQAHFDVSDAFDEVDKSVEAPVKISVPAASDVDALVKDAWLTFAVYDKDGVDLLAKGNPIAVY